MKGYSNNNPIFDFPLHEAIQGEKRPVTILVSDCNGKPLAGCEVMFSSPVAGTWIQGADNRGYLYLDELQCAVGTEIAVAVPADKRLHAKFTPLSGVDHYEIVFSND